MIHAHGGETKPMFMPPQAPAPPAPGVVRILLKIPWAHVLGTLDPGVIETLDRALMVQGRQGEVRSFFIKSQQKFLAGLLNRAVSALHALGFHAAIEWPAVPPIMPDRDPFRDGKAMRPEQREAVEAVERWHRGIIWAGTSFGKTLVMAALARDYPASRVLILAHRRDLLLQTARDVLAELLHEEIGELTSVQWEPRRVTVAMAQTLVSRARDPRTRAFLPYSPAHELLRQTDVLLVDEGHTTIGPTLHDLLLHCPAPIRVAVTGTPYRDDDPIHAARLEGIVGPPIYYMPTHELARRGLVSTTTVYLVDWGSYRFPCQYPEWPDCYLEGIVFQRRRNVFAALAAEASIRAGRPTLVFTQRREHGPEICRILEARGCPVPYVDGDTDVETRRALWQDLRDGRVMGAAVSLIAKEGLDMPAVKTIVLASGRKSNTEILQILGRGVRLKPDQDNALDLLDFDDRNCPILARHTDQRVEIWQREQHQLHFGFPGWWR